MPESLQGLSDREVRSKQILGLTNEVIDSYAPSVPMILLRNIFNVINIVVVPLLVFLGIFGLYMEVLAFSIFIIINSITAIIDELRIRKEIQKLKTQFQIKANVIRNGKMIELPVKEIVQDDLVKGSEGESIIADGVVVKSNYLQVDESVLTGESDYLKKEVEDQVFSGSFIVTGECYYRVIAVGNTNYSNRLAQESTKYTRKKSAMQINADRLIIFLIAASILLGVLNFLSTQGQSGLTIQDRILSVTAITALIIPQTLIFLFTLTFTISISKLFKKGVLVQKGASIENLTNIDMICFDKTGTITTNNNSLIDTIYINCEAKAVGTFYNSISDRFFGVSKTQKLITGHYKLYPRHEIADFQQIPFTSRQKFSLHRARIKGRLQQLSLGAYEALEKMIDPSVKNQVADLINEHERQGLRVLIGLFYSDIDLNYELKNYLHTGNTNPAQKIIVYIIEEELNTGISKLLEKFRDENIAVKIISGDSLQAVKIIAQKVGLGTEKIVDLSSPDIKLSKAALTYDIFTRAKPEDKVRIIAALKLKGHMVAMVGDGINDVLGLKAADVSIAMENGSKVTRNISDIVLLGNNYNKIPDIFFEGQNIIFNLKLSTKLFLAKSLFAIFLAVIAILSRTIFPIHPTTTLVFSFFGSSLPSYILIFTRDKLKVQKGFFKEIFISAVPVAILIASIGQLIYYYLSSKQTDPVLTNTTIAMSILGISLIYAINLLQISGRLRSRGLAIASFVIALSLGFLQTIMPLSIPDQIWAYIFTGVLFIGLIVILSYAFQNLKLKLKYKLLSLLIALSAFGIVLIFPFRSYYHTTRLGLENYLIVLIASLIGMVCIRVLSYLEKKLED